MTDWQPDFIALSTQGLEITEIAQRLGIPKGKDASPSLRELALQLDTYAEGHATPI